jgi:hypothetical protein
MASLDSPHLLLSSIYHGPNFIIDAFACPSGPPVFCNAEQRSSAAPRFFPAQSFPRNVSVPWDSQLEAIFFFTNSFVSSDNRGWLGPQDLPLQRSIPLYQSETIEEHLLDPHRASESDSLL